MINLNDCIELGLITKAHGVKGQLIVKLNSISFDEIRIKEPVFICINALPVPFFVESFTERTYDTAILALKDINSEQQTKELINCPIFIHKKEIKLKKSKQNIQTLKGYQVIDSNAGFIGNLVEIIDYQKNPVLQISNSGKEILIPLQPEFIHDIDEQKQTIHVTCPDGLLDIYL